MYHFGGGFDMMTDLICALCDSSFQGWAFVVPISATKLKFICKDCIKLLNEVLRKEPQRGWTE